MVGSVPSAVPTSAAGAARIETDYLVVGAGAAGLAFADALIAACDADVVLVDRRHGPGGHWNDAYPFVRLHQPSAFYGVNSRVLGSDSIDSTGPNAGFYQRATAAEICDYYQRVLEDLLASGRVRFFGMSDCARGGPDGYRLVSRLTGEATAVRVRRRVVDARYLETSIPATHTPSFGADPGVRLIPVNDLVRLAGPASGYTVIGAGKTAMDACLWLLDGGVPPEAIRWIRPRDATCTAQRALNTWLGDADLSAWMERARLNAARGIGDHLTDPRMASALTRMFANAEPAVARLEAFQAQALRVGGGGRLSRRPGPA